MKALPIEMTLDEIVKWTKREDKNINPLDFFRLHYDNSISRAELAKRDFALYRMLSRQKKLDKAIPKYNKRAAKVARNIGLSNIKKSKYGNNALAYYYHNCEGMTRGQLSNKVPGLYARLLREGNIDIIPFKNKKPDYGEDLMKYYTSHYNGMSREQVRIADKGFFRYLRKTGNINIIPLKRITRIYGDPIEEYKQKYLGFSRGQLGKKDPQLYQKIRRDNRIHEVPLQKKSRDIGSDSIHYVRVNYPGILRTTLRIIDNGLYQRIRKDKRINELRGPDLRMRGNQTRFGENLIDYYQLYHEGLTRGQLCHVDRYLYDTIRQKGLLKHIPKKD